MLRLFQALLILSILLLSWFGMMTVHEFGHVWAAWMSGGTVAEVVLHPLEFSRTDLALNPHPLFVAWGGAAIGTVLPLCLLWVAKWKRLSVFYLFQFFAGFCLVANGIYLSAVSFLKAADAGDLMRYGTPQWILILFGIVTVPLGISLWNDLGPYFGLGAAGGRVGHRAAMGTFIFLIVVIVVEILAGSR